METFFGVLKKLQLQKYMCNTIKLLYLLLFCTFFICLVGQVPVQSDTLNVPTSPQHTLQDDIIYNQLHIERDIWEKSIDRANTNTQVLVAIAIAVFSLINFTVVIYYINHIHKNILKRIENTETTITELEDKFNKLHVETCRSQYASMIANYQYDAAIAWGIRILKYEYPRLTKRDHIIIGTINNVYSLTNDYLNKTLKSKKEEDTTELHYRIKNKDIFLENIVNDLPIFDELSRYDKLSDESKKNCVAILRNLRKMLTDD